MRRRKRSCILSYNICSHKECRVKISTTFCSSLIPCIRRCGTQRECGIDVIGTSRRLLQCVPQGRVRPLSLSVGHCTVHLAAIKQAMPFSSFVCLCLSFLFFILFILPVLCFFLPTCLSWSFPSYHGNPLIVCFHKARPWLFASTHSFFIRVCVVAKSYCNLPHFGFSVCLFACLCVCSSVFPACTSAAPCTDFREILYRKLLWKYVEEIRIWNRVIISGILHENLSKFHFFPATLNRHKSTVLEWHGIRLLGQLKRYKYHANPK